MSARPVGLAVVPAALLAVVLAGCGKEPVTVPTLRLTPADQARCQRVTNALPDHVADQGKRKTQPAEALGAAWGDPAIVVQCGVPVPSDFTRRSACQEADGVGWFVPDSQVNDQSADVVMTTAGYRPVLQVTIPASYRPSGVAAAMVELAPVVKQYTRLVQPCR
ncbi:DUF3515 domain-containing protein [Nocardioides cynanchi]|uniref:DUF3515 domain-containing protein n=1 Tax=Nocardioides cynanchi TaxID=2558918 RepID=UPI00124944A4|nr:DUF3515 domain-containing protein [Nocardioides cynanchi]